MPEIDNFKAISKSGSLETLSNSQIKCIFAAHSYINGWNTALEKRGISSSQLRSLNFDGPLTQFKTSYPAFRKSIFVNPSMYCPYVFSQTIESVFDDWTNYGILPAPPGEKSNGDIIHFFDLESHARDPRILVSLYCYDHKTHTLEYSYATQDPYSIEDAMRKFGMHLMRYVSDIIGWERMIKSIPKDTLSRS